MHLFLALLTLLPIGILSSPIWGPQDQSQHYDVIIVGGGPSGLSALSGLARVRRKALLIDSGEYRNLLTRHVHDVIGSDGKFCTRNRSGSLLKADPIRCHSSIFPLESTPADFRVSDGINDERDGHTNYAAEFLGLQHF